MKFTVTKDPDGCWNVDGPYSRSGLSFPEMLEFVNRHYSDCGCAGAGYIEELVKRVEKLEKLLPNPDIEKLKQFESKTWPPPESWAKPLYGKKPEDYIPCMFGGLKEGVYGISCPCPRCSPTSV